MENIFKNIYSTNAWGNNNSNEYCGSSGSGSSVEYNENAYIPFLKGFILSKHIKSVVDLGCGDFRCGKMIYNDLNVMYTGYDTYDKIIDYNVNNNASDNIKFKFLDFYANKELIESADLCILKDVIQHWTLYEIKVFLDFIVKSKKFKYVLLCNCSNQKTHNTEIPTGKFRELSSDYYPLKRYNPIKMFTYNSKEVCMIKIKNNTE